MTERTKIFHIKILGRLLELLGVQMYKHRDAAVAELVANSWDAGAKHVWITIPTGTEYNKDISEISIEDDGCGMNEASLQDKYLVIGRNRRIAESSEEFKGRRVMGRKGIGKLAGFGIASMMKVETWIDNQSIEISLDLNHLKNNPTTETKDDIDKNLDGTIRDEKPKGIHEVSCSGTRIRLSTLKQQTSIDINALHISLARRFSRTVQGHMKIFINEEPLKPPKIDIHKNSPPLDNELETERLDNNEVKYTYSYSNSPLTRDRNLQGWTILVNGKTAQAPPFFFNVDINGTSQHSSKYLLGTIEADFLDKGSTDETDIVSTDRQEIDWDREEAKSLWDWGRKLTQKIFNEIGERNAEESKNIVEEHPEYKARIDALDKPLRIQCLKFIGSIGKIKVYGDEMSAKEKILQMADQIIKAFEYRHFIDVINDIEEASENPENLEILLTHLEKWEVLESRSILEIIKGRIRVVDKFYDMIINRAPETANRDLGADNFHDLIAGFPWLLNPEWQVYLEEKSISTILKKLGENDFPELMKNKRVDFLALQGSGTIAVIEIKSVDDVLPLEELRKLEDYKNALTSAHKEKLVCVLIFGGKHSIPKETWQRYEESVDFKILEWKNVFSANKNYYLHYRAVLENHISDPNFRLKADEIKNTRRMLEKDSVYRNVIDRKEGLGIQDINIPIS
ncbi:MAG TPA: hypothetical protein DD381_07230 [Lentisphaeria bacterium]|nr:MAG: hypothetical protein A2X47_05700 [Lentisphaerae bacterium GWF2_38_69]HBM16114.1 hypothetical protein [Lentisphaeria bacterium]